MPRTTRLDMPGALHHVMGRTISNRLLCEDRYDRACLLTRMQGCCYATGVRILAWCLMPNHIHILLRTAKVTLSSFMARLLTGHATFMNTRHGLKGHLFQGRYRSILVADEEYLSELVRYIHLNPVRGGLVADLEALRKYRWCGHGIIAGGSSPEWMDTSSVLERFFDDRRSPVEVYLEYLREGLEHKPGQPAPLHALTRSGIDGPSGRCVSKEWDVSREHLAGDWGAVRRVARELPEEMKARFRKRRGTSQQVADVFSEIEARWGVSRADLGSRSWRGVISDARAYAIQRLTGDLGFGMAEAGRLIGISRQATFKAARRIESQNGSAEPQPGAKVVKVDSDPGYRSSEKKTR